jgi:hypothetical protein
MTNPICESGKLNTVKNLANATAGINAQGGIRIVIAANRTVFDQQVNGFDQQVNGAIEQGLERPRRGPNGLRFPRRRRNRSPHKPR